MFTVGRTSKAVSRRAFFPISVRKTSLSTSQRPASSLLSCVGVPQEKARSKHGRNSDLSNKTMVISITEGRSFTSLAQNDGVVARSDDRSVESWTAMNNGQHSHRFTGRAGVGLYIESSREQRFQWSGVQQYAFFSSDTSLKKKDDSVDEKTAVPLPAKMTTITNRPLPSRKLGKTPVPTPPSAPKETNALDQLKDTTPKSVIRKGVDLTSSIVKAILAFMLKLPGRLFFYVTNPSEIRSSWQNLKEMAKEEANHYWVGTKLLWADIQTSRNLLNKTLEGNSLTRRERKQLLRTVTDLFRLIPFSMFVLIPFMEFALPFALRLFPNMLPSTYQDSLKAEENMKRELKSRIAMTQFFQETLEELAKAQKRKASARKKELEEAGVDPAEEIEAQKDSAQSMLEFLEKARSGEMVPPDVIIRYANYFSDDLTLDNMPRMQLINMCKYMGIQPYGADSFLRFQLRHKIRVLKEDDQRILWEGIGSLTKMELREACQERGMRSTGLSKDSYCRALQQWLDLSVNKDVPIALLIMSRTFFLREEMFDPAPSDDGKSLSGLADAISGLDKEILNEVILEVATKEEKMSDPDVRKIKLEVLSQQNELIREEAAAREAAAKKKEVAAAAAAEKEKAEDSLEVSSSESEEKTQSTNEKEVLESDKVASHTSTNTEIGPVEKTTVSDESLDETNEEERKADENRSLSAAEMDAISQLISDDPVSKEREELERIKAAMKDAEHGDAESPSIDSFEDKVSEPSPLETSTVPHSTSPSANESEFESISNDDLDMKAKEVIDAADKNAAIEADESTTLSLDSHKGSEGDDSPDKDDDGEKEEEAEDPIIARLKERVSSMVDKIEVQLSETQVKIGDKLHYLDKDRDGILTREEMASALQQVLKRKISFEEAMEIANEMDGNQDGVFTVEELIRWIDEHKLVKFVAEGRDADMDKIMESQSSNQTKSDDMTSIESSEKPRTPDA